MNKALFLDRDGVINVQKGYITRFEEIEFNFEILDLIKRYPDFIKIIITNQSGISRGYFSEQEYLELERKINEKLCEYGIFIHETYHCNHHPDELCSCRKPNIDFFKDAIEKYNIDVTKSIMVGDRDSDIEAGKNAGIKVQLKVSYV